MKVLVVGGTRFIGPYAVRRLAEAGHEIAVFHWARTGAELPEGVGRIPGDRRNLGDFADEFRRFAPEGVLDMIPMNEEDARGVVTVFRDVARRVVAISSEDVYRAYDVVRGPGPALRGCAAAREAQSLRTGWSGGVREDTRRAGRYGRSGPARNRPAAAGGVRSGGLPAPALRLREAHGRRTARPTARGGVAGWRWTHGYVEDVASAIALAVTDERAAGRVYNVGEAEPLPWAERVREIGRAAGWDGEGVVVTEDRLPEHLDWGLDTEQHWFVDTSRIRRELGYREVVFREEALRRTVLCERGHPPEKVELASFDYAAEDAAFARLNR